MDVAHVIGVFAILSTVFISAFFQLSAFRWTIFIGVVLLSLSIFDFLSPGFYVVFSLFYFIAAAFANLHTLRQRYLIAPLLPFLKKKLPSISATEREAIEAGNTWWEKQLFGGRPYWRDLFSIPKPTMSAEEQNFLNHQVDHVCSMLDDWEIIFSGRDMPKHVWDYLKEEKFLEW